MTVREMIAALQTLPPQLPVVIPTPDRGVRGVYEEVGHRPTAEIMILTEDGFELGDNPKADASAVLLRA